MVLSLIFGKKYPQSKFETETGLEIISFDTMLTEEHLYNSRVTSYPVETGTLISDHILKLPVVIRLSGVVSDTPLAIFSSFNRSAAAFNALVNLFEKREVFTAITGIKVYENMAITSLDIPRNIKTGQTLTFNIELQQIIFSDVLLIQNSTGNVFAGRQSTRSSQIVAQNTNYPQIQNDPANSLKDQASSTVNVGIQSPNPIPAAIARNVLANKDSILEGL